MRVSRNTSVAEYNQYRKNLGLPPVEWEKSKGERENKYHAKKVHLHGFIFDSKIEAAYYMELRYQLCAKLIRDLQIHTKFPLLSLAVSGDQTVKSVVDEWYEDDFDYVDLKTNEWVVVDVKSKFTVKLANYQRKKKRMLEQYGIQITEVIR